MYFCIVDFFYKIKTRPVNWKIETILAIVFGF